MEDFRRCFVITPYGDPKSPNAEEREIARHLGLVNKRILQPAARICAKLGTKVIISDGRENKKAGPIFEKILSDLWAADAAIAIVFSNKPNVYLEIGLFNGMWRKPILLQRADFDGPTDINNHQRVQYSADCLLGAAGPAREVAKILAGHLYQALNAEPYQRPSYLPETTVASGSAKLYNRFSKAVRMPEWSRILNEAEKEIYIAVPKAFQLKDREFPVAAGADSIDTKLPQLLLTRALKGVKVTVMMSHEENYSEAVSKRGAEEVKFERDSIAAAYKVWSTQMSTYLYAVQRQEDSRLSVDGFRVIQMQNRYLPYRVTLTEKRALVTLRFFSEPFNSGPCIDVRPTNGENEDDRPIYAQVRRELLKLIEENEVSSRERFLEAYPQHRHMM